MIKFEYIHLAPKDGTPLLLEVPCTMNKYYVGRWLDNAWRDEHNIAFKHLPVSWISLDTLDKIPKPLYRTEP